MSLCVNSRGIAIQDLQATADHGQVLRSKEKNIIEKRRNLGGAASNKVD